jgi:hypothetical protein
VLSALWRFKPLASAIKLHTDTLLKTRRPVILENSFLKLMRFCFISLKCVIFLHCLSYVITYVRAVQLHTVDIVYDEFGYSTRYQNPFFFQMVMK